MGGEKVLNAGALISRTLTVDEPNFAQALFRCGVEVVLDDVEDVSWSKPVKIDLFTDLQLYGVVIGHAQPPM